MGNLEQLPQIGGNAAAALLFLIFGFVYLLPYFIAVARDHHRQAWILALNFLAGWTLAGWGAAMIWAFTDARIRCPRCAERPRVGATVCPWCAYRLENGENG